MKCLFCFFLQTLQLQKDRGADCEQPPHPECPGPPIRAELADPGGSQRNWPPGLCPRAPSPPSPLKTLTETTCPSPTPLHTGRELSF